MRPGCLPCHNLHILTDRHIASDFSSQPGDSHTAHTSSGRTHIPQCPTMSVSLEEACGGLFLCLSPFDFYFPLLTGNEFVPLLLLTKHFMLWGFFCLFVCSFAATGVAKKIVWALGITHQSRWGKQLF